MWGACERKRCPFLVCKTTDNSRSWSLSLMHHRLPSDFVRRHYVRATLMQCNFFAKNSTLSTARRTRRGCMCRAPDLDNRSSFGVHDEGVSAGGCYEDLLFMHPRLPHTNVHLARSQLAHVLLGQFQSFATIPFLAHAPHLSVPVHSEQ